MKTFKSYLEEMVWYIKSPRTLPGGYKRKAAYLADTGIPKGSIHYSTMETGHKIFKQMHDDNPTDRTTYHVRSPDGTKHHFTLTGFHRHGIFSVHTATKWNDAPDHFGEKVYHHLVMNHHPIMSGHSQNTGSKKLWDSLAKRKDLVVTGYDTTALREVPARTVYANYGPVAALSLSTRFRGDYLRLLVRKKS